MDLPSKIFPDFSTFPPSLAFADPKEQQPYAFGRDKKKGMQQGEAEPATIVTASANGG